MDSYPYAIEASEEIEPGQSQIGPTDEVVIGKEHLNRFSTSAPLPELEQEQQIKSQLAFTKLTPSFIKDKILNRDIGAKIAPILFVIGGLPDSKKTTAILKVIASLGGHPKYVKESGINNYDHAATISPPPGKKMIIETFSQEEGYSKVIHSVIENISRTKRDILFCGYEYEFTHKLEQLQSFAGSSLRKHFEKVCWILYKQTKNQRQQNQNPDNWNKSFTTGIALINVWDVGFNKVATYVLPHLAGHLTISFVWMFLDLMRDIDKLYMSPDLPDNRFDRSRNDKELILRWRARIHYLLRFAKLASSTAQKSEEKRNKTCHIVASIAQGTPSDDVFDKIKKLKTSVESAARQMEVDHLTDYENILKFTELDDACIEALEELFKNIVHDQLNNAPQVPLSFIFLRSTFYNNELYIRKGVLWEVAKELNFSHDDFKKFCKVFTSIGSIIDVSLINESSDLIILKPVDFINELDKLFYPSPEVDPLVTKYGIVTESTASRIFGPDALIFMEFLEIIHLAFKLPSSKFDIKLDGLYAYYIPNIHTSPPLLACEPTCLHFLRSVNRPMSQLQVLFAEKFLQNEHSSLMVSHLPPNNITCFKVFSSIGNEEGIAFDFVYLGDAIEFRLPDDNKNKEICENIISICKEILPDDIQYNFAIMCSKEDGSVANTLQRVHHLLPLKGTCRNCHISLDTASDAVKTWNSVIQKNGVPAERKLNGASLTQTELIDLSNKMSRLSIEGANVLAKALGCGEFADSQLDLDTSSKWRYFMKMILQWEEYSDPSIESQDSKKVLRSKKELATRMLELSEDPNATKLSSDDRQLLLEISASIDLTVRFKRTP